MIVMLTALPFQTSVNSGAVVSSQETVKVYLRNCSIVRSCSVPFASRISGPVSSGVTCNVSPRAE